MGTPAGESFRDPTDLRIREHRKSPWLPSYVERSDNEGLTARKLSILRLEAAAGTKRKRGAGPSGSEILCSLSLPFDLCLGSWLKSFDSPHHQLQ